MTWVRPIDTEEAGVPGDSDGETEELYVGTLAGTIWDVETSPSEIEFSRPVDGKVIATHLISDARDSGSVADLVDVHTGATTRLGEFEGIIGDAIIDPGTNEWYWTIWPGDGGISGVWRQSLDGGPAERITGPDPNTAGYLVASLDGRWIAVWGGHPNDLVFDTTDSTFTLVPTAHIGDIVGFMGDRLIAYVRGRSDGGLHFPLYAIDVHDGSMTTIVEGNGMFAVIFGSDDGPQLLHDGYDTNGSRQFYAQSRSDQGRDRLIYSADSASDPEEDGPFLARYGLDESGYAPLVLHSPYQVPGLLVSLSDGTVYSVPPIGG